MRRQHHGRAAQLPLVLLACCSAIIVIGGGGIWLDQQHHLPASGAVPSATYVGHLRELDAQVEAARVRTRRDQHSWLALQSLAESYRERALFSGTTIDLTRAESALTQSFTLAGAQAGPFLSRAQLSATLHRYQTIAADLHAATDIIPYDNHQHAAVVSLRAGVAFACGRYTEAFAAYREALAQRRTPMTLFAFADAMAATGDANAAEDLIIDAENLAREEPPATRAWLALQHGVYALDRGQWAQAEAHYSRAQAMLSGWWLIDARVAELTALKGDIDGAIPCYEQLAKRTGKPELMDALAQLLHQQNRPIEAAHWTELAGRAYDDLLAGQPEAAYGHALDHYLALPHETARALDLAQRNHALRPGGEASVKLARALLNAGQCEQARGAIEAVLNSPYDTAVLHATAAAIYASCGDQVRTAVELALARKINPHA